MRKVLLCVVLVACGKDGNNGDANHPPLEASVGDAGPDAPPAVACTPTSGTTVSVRQIGKVNGSAVLATAPPGDDRLFVVEQNGRLRIFDHENLVTTPFLDLTEQSPTCDTIGDATSCNARADCLAVTDAAQAFQNCSAIVAGGTGGEQGLLGLAFHPQYATNGQFYVFLTTPNPTGGGDPFGNVVLGFKRSASDPNVADPASKQIILAIADPFSNHNGGMIEFGSDGYLYIGTGDGGSAGDPRRNGQNTNALLAKMLRIDVDHPSNGNAYGIPSDNPFVAGGGAPEVFMYGLRNPWRWSFDRANGDMWIGDVGQGQIEEVDYVPAAQQSGKNFGWSAYEGSVCCQDQSDHCVQNPPDQACDMAGKTFPQIEKTHGGDGWNAVIGGQVYRGPCYPDLVGTYFYDDNGHHTLATATVSGGTVTTTDLPGTWPQSPASLHADASGELYVTTTSGAVLHLEAGP